MKRWVVRTYVSTIGFDSRRITRPVLSYGLDTDDRIVLLRPATETDDSRAEETIYEVTQMLEEIEPDITTSIERITHDDFPTAVLECSDVLRAAEGRTIVTLSGGARDVFLPFAVASLAHVQSIETVLTFSDVDGKVRECALPTLTAEIPDAAWPTLAQVRDAGDRVSIPELAERSSSAKSTVTRHVIQLTEANAIETWRDGKTKYARISLTGRLLLRVRNE